MRFSDIPGHDEVKRRIIEMADSDRVPHALLLHGISGIGKFAMARAFAQYIHCENRSGGDSCGQCPSCLRHQSFNHIDTVFSFPVLKGKLKDATSDDYIDLWREFIAKEPFMPFHHWLSMLGNPNGQPAMYVSESASLLHRLSFTTHNSRYKVVLMWLPERMQEECANKLLKLVEEPFADTIFIMTSDDPAGILPTIYSRTQRVEMKRLSDETVAAYASSVTGADPADAMAAAYLAEGSVTRAIERLKASDGQTGMLELFKRLMRGAYKRDIHALREWSVEAAALGREGCQDFLDYCQRMTRENFIRNIGDRRLNYMGRDEEEFSVRFARFINERNVERLIEEMSLAQRDIAGNANAKIVMMDLAIKVIMLIKA